MFLYDLQTIDEYDQGLQFYYIKKIGNSTIIKSIFPNGTQKPEWLARAGFYYEGNDVVTCAFCRVRLYDWESIDCPIRYHRIVMSFHSYLKRLTSQQL